MKKIYIIIGISLLTCALSAQSNSTWGKGLQILGQDSSYYLKLGFRFQNLAIAEWSLADDELGFESSFESNALVRRSRLKFDGWIQSPKLKYKLELALSNRDNGGGNSDLYNNAANIILDAHMTYNFYEGFYVRFGQGKLAGNRERVISSANLQFVDRSRLNSRFTLDRDVFLQIGNSHKIGEQFLMRESISMSQGEGKNQTDGHHGGYNYTYRVELLPFGAFQSKGDYIGSAIKRESTPKLAIGITYDNNRNAIRERGQKGSYIVNEEGGFVGKTLNSFQADLMFKYQGISVMAEYADRYTADGISEVFDVDGGEIGSFYTGSAYNISMGHMFDNDYEIAIRYTDVSADVSRDEKHYTLGLNKFFIGHKLKLQTDFSRIARDGGQDSFLWRTQMEIHF